jgi:hypothetical protein
MSLATGGCQCGAVRFEAHAAPTYVCVCHCNSCRKATGGAMVPWVTFNEADVTFTQGQPREYQSSPGVTRGHCARCGTGISYRVQRRAGDIDLTLASMDDPHAFQPTVHIWVSDKLPWLVIPDGLPQYQRTVPNG